MVRCSRACAETALTPPLPAPIAPHAEAQSSAASSDLADAAADRRPRAARGERWLDLILEKTAEVRRDTVAPGGCWLGFKGHVYAWMELGPARQIRALADFAAAEPSHRVLSAPRLPYGDHTHLWPLVCVRVLAEPVPFRVKTGPVTWIRFESLPATAAPLPGAETAAAEPAPAPSKRPRWRPGVLRAGE